MFSLTSKIVDQVEYKQMNTFEINGVTYQEIPQSPRRFSKSMSTMMMATMMMAGGFMEVGGRERKGPRVDLITEYGLIQNKKSKLSRRDREWVVATFERRFRKVKTSENSTPDNQPPEQGE